MDNIVLFFVALFFLGMSYLFVRGIRSLVGTFSVDRAEDDDKEVDLFEDLASYQMVTIGDQTLAGTVRIQKRNAEDGLVDTTYLFCKSDIELPRSRWCCVDWILIDVSDVEW